MKNIKPKILYHASPNKNIEILEPRAIKTRKISDGEVIFATPDLKFASMFLNNKVDDRWSAKGIINGKYYYLISDKERFLDTDNGGAIYYLKPDTFFTDPNKGMGTIEWVSRETVKPFKKVLYENSLDLMLDLGVEIYFIPIKKINEFRKSKIIEEKINIFKSFEKFKYKKDNVRVN